MRDLGECSGPWGGFWIQHPKRGKMSIKMAIRGGVMVGSGTDLSGPFTLNGTYSDSGNVSITKDYPWLRVEYVGTWNGSFIGGNWRIPGADSGVFELWPVDEELSLEAFHQQLALPETRTPALPAPG